MGIRQPEIRDYRLGAVHIINYSNCFVIAGSVVLAETQVDCYQCVWQSSWSVPGPDEDFCRPATFNGQRVTVAPCPQGCVTTVMYETGEKLISIVDTN